MLGGGVVWLHPETVRASVGAIAGKVVELASGGRVVEQRAVW